METLTCAPCGVAAEAMQRCGGCRTIKYCSRDCQRQLWRASHKHECTRLDRPPAAESSSAGSGTGSAPDYPLSTRTTFRMNLVDMMRMTDPGNSRAERLVQREADPADTIYYLMTAIEGINDRTLFGPFRTREAFVPSLFSKISSCAPLAIPGLEEYLSMAGLDAFTYYTARSPEIGQNKLEVWLHKESNAVVKVALPCETWKLMYIESIAGRPRGVPGTTAAQVTKMEVHETFLSKAEAEAAGPAVARELAGSHVVEEVNDPSGKVWSCGRDPISILQVSYDSGETID